MINNKGMNKNTRIKIVDNSNNNKVTDKSKQITNYKIIPKGKNSKKKQVEEIKIHNKKFTSTTRRTFI